MSDSHEEEILLIGYFVEVSVLFHLLMAPIQPVREALIDDVAVGHGRVRRLSLTSHQLGYVHTNW